METNKAESTKEVFVDCPVCCSGNRFRLENLSGELVCEDCGFVLAEVLDSSTVDSGRCGFCGSEYFYFESPLSLSFLGKDSVCYVCEAKYKGVRLHNPDQKFNADTEAEAWESNASKRWQERVERYDRGAG